MFTEKAVIGVIGSGAMGSGIAQVAASAGLQVKVYDNDAGALTNIKYLKVKTMTGRREAW